MDDDAVAGFVQIARPRELTARWRAELIACWTVVANSGGAVVPLAFPVPPVDAEQVAPAADALVAGLAPDRGRLLLATVEGTLAGWLVVRRELHPLIRHWGVVNHVQTHPAFRGRGIGSALLRRARGTATEMGLEQLHIGVREGLGLEDFYRRLGWTEVGRWPGALRLAPGDDRDEILMALDLRTAG
ncbi:GNAT family N-acetyltransferase [Streptomyces lydicus]|uniref:GNAT family N-acetyltransferase n=1 Tax=Streptomyces lydicus TaxID=47763 RepID=A0A1D7VVX7_9ACTN|nr:GNAT family N-acetyltransferase [Streptomyces lydicus]AOP50897.1 GNAT family N-acetyltransferase [Streptomyces lydicus]